MSEVAKFFREVGENIEKLKGADELREKSKQWVRDVGPYKYPYNFTWMGRPIIQLPQDIMAMQEVIFKVKPELIIETGVAHGGSLIFYASMLELLGKGRVLGIDIDIRAHNRAEIEDHPMSKRIDLIQGSSIDKGIVHDVHQAAKGKGPVLLVLDSNHTHEHVLEELRAYGPLVTKDSYAVVFDTAIEELPKEAIVDRPWGPGNSPMTAVHAYLKECDRFDIDTAIDAKLLISVAPQGYLRCVK